MSRREMRFSVSWMTSARSSSRDQLGANVGCFDWARSDSGNKDLEEEEARGAFDLGPAGAPEDGSGRRWAASGDPADAGAGGASGALVSARGGRAGGRGGGGGGGGEGPIAEDGGGGAGEGEW